MPSLKTTGLLLLFLTALSLPLTGCATKPKPPIVVTEQKPFTLPDTKCQDFPRWTPKLFTKPSSTSSGSTRQQSEASIWVAEAWAAYECERLDNKAKLDAYERAKNALASKPTS